MSWWFVGTLVVVAIVMELPWERLGPTNEGVKKDEGLPGSAADSNVDGGGHPRGPPGVTQEGSGQDSDGPRQAA